MGWSAGTVVARPSAGADEPSWQRDPAFAWTLAVLPRVSLVLRDADAGPLGGEDAERAAGRLALRAPGLRWGEAGPGRLLGEAVSAGAAGPRGVAGRGRAEDPARGPDVASLVGPALPAPTLNIRRGAGLEVAPGVRVEGGVTSVDEGTPGALGRVRRGTGAGGGAGAGGGGGGGSGGGSGDSGIADAADVRVFDTTLGVEAIRLGPARLLVLGGWRGSMVDPDRPTPGVGERFPGLRSDVVTGAQVRWAVSEAFELIGTGVATPGAAGGGSGFVDLGVGGALRLDKDTRLHVGYQVLRNDLDSPALRGELQRDVLTISLQIRF